VLWLKGGKIETRLSDGRVNKVEITFFIVVEGGSWTVLGE
jgi:hypothetical protein